MNDIDRGGLGFLFLYIGIGIALLVTVVSGIQVVSDIINRMVVTDSMSWDYIYRYHNLAEGAAFLLVSFIVLFIILRKARGVTTDYSNTIWHILCRAIVLIIITFSVGVFAVSLAYLFGGFLSGTASLNSSLRMLFATGVGAMVFYYYRGVLHGVWRERKKEERVFVIAVSAMIVLIVVVAGVLSNPFTRPQLERTYETLESAQGVYSDVRHFYTQKDRLPLPDDLEDVYRSGSAAVVYEVTNETTFRLCTSFEVLPEGTTLPSYPHDRFKIEEVGETCFDFDLSEG